MEYFNIAMHIICCVSINTTVIRDLVDIIISLITGVSLIIGIGYLRPLKDKANSATFNFWSQLLVRLKNIRNWLLSDAALLNNMYSKEIRNQWDDELGPSMERVKEFKKLISQTLEYIEKTEDQMPAYNGWTNDYNNVIAYLNDMLLYDIADQDNYFKFCKRSESPSRNSYHSEICKSLDTICTGILNAQKETEQKICKKNIFSNNIYISDFLKKIGIWHD